jgi:RNA polymerase subunit RPABC4/transcription elongation factor Spt4
MATRNQPSTRFREEIGIVSPWVFFFAALAFVSVFVLLMCFIGRDHNPPPVAVRPLLGLIAGTVISCYIVLISYVNKDAGRRGMSRTLWTLIAIFVPNGLGIVLYFVLRKPRTAHCPQCEAVVEPGFSFCPRCSNRLQPVCPHCRRSINAGDKFCPYCGGAVEADAGAPSPNSPPPPPAS